MRPIATDIARSVVCVSVRVPLCVQCMLGTRVSCAKTAEPINMLFGGWLLWVQETKY